MIRSLSGDILHRATLIANDQFLCGARAGKARERQLTANKKQLIVLRNACKMLARNLEPSGACLSVCRLGVLRALNPVTVSKKAAGAGGKGRGAKARKAGAGGLNEFERMAQGINRCVIESIQATDKDVTLYLNPNVPKTCFDQKVPEDC